MQVLCSYSQLNQHISQIAAAESAINDDRCCRSGRDQRQHAWCMSSPASKAFNESRLSRPRRLMSLVLPTAGADGMASALFIHWQVQPLHGLYGPLKTVMPYVVL